MESNQKPLKENPRSTANIVSIITFWWTIDLFKQGYRKVLEFGDLFKPLDCDRSESLGDRLERNWYKQVNSPGRPSLIKALARTFWREYAILGFTQAFNDLFVRIAQPLVLGRLLLYFREGSTMSSESALYYSIALVALNALSAISINQYILHSFQNGMKVRIAVCSTVYRKALRLSKTALGDTSPGKVVNLLSNDVNRFDIVSVFIHSMWSAPLLTVIVGYLLWIESGWGGLIGMFVIFIVTPIQAYTGKLSSKFRLQTALRTDERVRLMDEIISGIQVIKYYAWEIPFATLIRIARKMELKIVRKNSYVRALYMTFMLFTTRMALFTTMLAIVMLGNELTASKVYVTAAYYGIIANTMSQMWVRGIAEIAEALVSLRRIRKFLEFEEKDSEKLENSNKYEKVIETNGDIKVKKINHENGYSELPPKIAISLKNVVAKWDGVKEQGVKTKKMKKADLNLPEEDDSSRLTLDNLNIDIPSGKLIGVVGAVGAGKSSLLQAILRELPLKSGSISYTGDVSYASQEAWIFAASVRQNILFGQEMHKERYDAVVKACALIRDFEQLPFGDKTIVGERGTALSGGQKARISLARAVYRTADIYLLDDPLSAVDAHVGKHLFEECIGPKGRLGRQKATRILVTHQVHYLKDADIVVVLKEGKIEHMGSPKELFEMGIEKMLESEEYRENSSEFDEHSRRGSSRSRQNSVSSTKSTSTNGSDDEDEANTKKEESPKQNLEESSKGKVKSVFTTYLRAGAHPVIFIFVFFLFFLTQAIASTIDWWTSYWTHQEELRQFNSINNATLEIPEETNINPSINIINAILAVAGSSSEPLSSEWCAIIHGSLLAGLFFFAISRSIAFYTSTVRSSQKLHDDMFNGVVGAPMRFFDTNPSGRILNRFSKDCGAVDEFLPKAILDAGQILLNMVGAIIVTALVNPLYIIPIFVLGIIFQILRKIYLKTSKNIKRLESICRSPVFTHLAATLNGLSTIRAFSAQNTLTEEFDDLQDVHTAAWYMFITTSTAFGFCLDLLCMTFFAIVTFSFLLMPNSSGDQVGLAITQVMALTGMVQWGVRQSAEVANQLMSVERILEYKGLEKEKQPEVPLEVSKSWPVDGKLKFNKVSYRYHEEGEKVLKSVEFEVKPGEKVGIVGRTGAGKSSLIGVLFRIAIVDGEVLIDDIDTARLELMKLRQKISIIPQDPVLFSGTLRRNLDPFEEYPDSALWQALDEVELKEIASGPLGLQTVVAAGGSNFSVGQRQLLCLARAILRNNKILVLDEATANVDPRTDELIQLTIRKRFAHCTVLTVAHRLHTIMDSDKVLVMDAGRVEEFGPPYEILQLPAGIFREMINATGQQESANLIQIAKTKYDSDKMK